MADDNNLTSDPGDSTDVYQVPQGEVENTEPVDEQPLFRVYKGGKIAVGRRVGSRWKHTYDAAMATYEMIHKVWDECYKYYNNDQSKSIETPAGVFKRGDGTENIIYSNLNVLLPAVYSKDPNFTCSSTDEVDEEFCKCMERVINQLMRRQDKIYAKPKIKRASGFGLLTNFGVLKLNWTRKDDSVEMAQQDMTRILDSMNTCENEDQLEMLYGQLAGLEENMEVLEPEGAKLGVVLPQNLCPDPYAEQNDALDGKWMIERTMIQTNFLNAHYTEPNPEADPDDLESRVYTYKPTHRAVFTSGAGGERDEGLGIVLKAINPDTAVTSHTSEERAAYINLEYTECAYVWDKMTRRVYLFAMDDWKWPIWVWDAKELFNAGRFFPYFIIAFGFSTGGTVSVGETAYVLDQQDEINDINRQVARIRRTIFDFFCYNSSKINKDEAEKFVNALRGNGSPNDPHILGVNAGDNKITDLFESVKPPQMDFEALFTKQPIMDAANRITNTNDALRGVQFKAYTNEEAVQSYQDSLRLTIGSKVDVIEDTVSDMGRTLAELAVQYMTQQDVADLIGEKNATAWRQMSPQEFRTTYSLEIVAGSMEKPNSAFKKKEAIQVTQAVGQFAQAAPGATLMIMLDMLSNAFTDINIKDEQWDMLRTEIAANLNRGDSTGGANAQGGAGAQQSGAGQDDDMVKLFMSLPPQEQQKIIQMKQQGKSAQEIIQYAQQVAQKQQTGGGPPRPQAVAAA